MAEHNCVTHHDACDCREAAHSAEVERLKGEVKRIKGVKNCYYECVSKAEADARIAEIGEQLRQSQAYVERLRGWLSDLMAPWHIAHGRQTIATGKWAATDWPDPQCDCRGCVAYRDLQEGKGTRDTSAERAGGPDPRDDRIKALEEAIRYATEDWQVDMDRQQVALSFGPARLLGDIVSENAELRHKAEAAALEGKGE